MRKPLVAWSISMVRSPSLPPPLPPSLLLPIFLFFTLLPPNYFLFPRSPSLLSFFLSLSLLCFLFYHSPLPPHPNPLPLALSSLPYSPPLLLRLPLYPFLPFFPFPPLHLLYQYYILLSENPFDLSSFPCSVPTWVGVGALFFDSSPLLPSSPFLPLFLSSFPPLPLFPSSPLPLFSSSPLLDRKST